MLLLAKINSEKMETNIISIVQKEQSEQTMTSLEIAELTGKQHKDVMKAIRNMEPAWVKVQGRKFALLSRTYQLPNGGTKVVPCYVLTKTECLYIADDVHLLVATRKDETGGGVGYGRDADTKDAAVGKAHYLQRRTAELLSPSDNVYHDVSVEEYSFHPYF